MRAESRIEHQDNSGGVAREHSSIVYYKSLRVCLILSKVLPIFLECTKTGEIGKNTLGSRTKSYLFLKLETSFNCSSVLFLTTCWTRYCWFFRTNIHSLSFFKKSNFLFDFIVFFCYLAVLFEHLHRFL